MREDIKRRLEEIGYNALMEEVMDLEDSKGKEVTMSEYMKLNCIDFNFDEQSNGSKSYASLTITSFNEEIYYFRITTAC